MAAVDSEGGESAGRTGECVDKDPGSENTTETADMRLSRETPEEGAKPEGGEVEEGGEKEENQVVEGVKEDAGDASERTLAVVEEKENETTGKDVEMEAADEEEKAKEVAEEGEQGPGSDTGLPEEKSKSH